VRLSGGSAGVVWVSFNIMGFQQGEGGYCLLAAHWNPSIFLVLLIR